jgi:hypothetical protein
VIAVLLPALTADVWRLAAATTYRNLGGAALLTIGVLLLLVARRLRRELEPAFAARSRALASRATTPEATRVGLRAVTEDDMATIVDELPAETFAGAWPRAADEYAPYLVAAEDGALRRPLAARLVVTAGAIGVLFTAYIYAVLAVTVPTRVAATWSGSHVFVRLSSTGTQCQRAVRSIYVDGGPPRRTGNRNLPRLCTDRRVPWPQGSWRMRQRCPAR